MNFDVFSKGLLISKFKSPFFTYLIAAVAHILLAYLSWHSNALFSLISFIPILVIISNEKYIKLLKHLSVYFFLLITNYVVTFWLLDVNKTDGLFAIIINALYLYLSYPISLLVNKLLKNYTLSFIISYFFIEWLHFNWLFSWPWLTLGYIFGDSENFIQWYKFTGVLGGSAWILLCNYFVFKKRFSAVTILLCIIPLLLSICILKLTKPTESKNEFKIILSQPNINYKDSLVDNQRISRAIKQLNKFLDKKDSVNLILLPELFLDAEYWKETFKESASYLDLNKYISETFPKSTLLVGATIRKLKKTTETYSNRNFEFDKFNVIAAIDSSKKVRFKTKKEFIPKTENWPKYLNDLIPSPSSANYSLSTDSNFFDISSKRIFTAICYESIFGSYFSESLGVKSDFIVLLASESFLNSNKTALKQYLNICKIRAIENSKYFIKCSNEGYSAIISPTGKIVELLPYNAEGYIYYSF